MPDEKQSLFLCPNCGLPFKTEDNLNLHTENWHMDESNQQDRSRKQGNPVELLWRDLIYRIYETPDGFQGLSEAEKRYFAVNVLAAEVYNGGFSQYFFNNSGSYYKYTLLGLEEMGALESLTLLQRARLSFFDDENIPENTGKRRERILELESDVRLQLLDELDKEFYKDPDGLEAKSLAYAKLYGLL